MKRRNLLFAGLKRRNFLSGLFFIPLGSKARFFAPKPCGEKVFGELPPYPWVLDPKAPKPESVRCSLRKGHKGPHVWLNPRA